MYFGLIFMTDGTSVILLKLFFKLIQSEAHSPPFFGGVAEGRGGINHHQVEILIQLDFLFLLLNCFLILDLIKYSWNKALAPKNTILIK